MYITRDGANVFDAPGAAIYHGSAERSAKIHREGHIYIFPTGLILAILPPNPRVLEGPTPTPQMPVTQTRSPG